MQATSPPLPRVVRICTVVLSVSSNPQQVGYTLRDMNTGHVRFCTGKVYFIGKTLCNDVFVCLIILLRIKTSMDGASIKLIIFFGCLDHFEMFRKFRDI